MHGIEETNFHQLYKACIETAPLEYLFAQEEVWQDYYQKNNYSLYHHKIDKEQLNTISQYL